MLWQKESTTKDSLYLDLFKSTNFATNFVKLHQKKNNETSLRVRKEGNQKYAEKDIEGAMTLYNRGICFAESESEYLSLAYANRSMCFFQLELYDKCLVDIQLAKGNYPKHLLSKLEIREQKCLELMQSKVRSTTDQPLQNFVSNGLKIEKNSKYGRFVTARRDINIGETLLVEESYVCLPDTSEFRKCATCCLQKMNFIPCESCADVMYCSKKCSKNNFHYIECDMIVDSNCCDGKSLHFILRSVIIGINAFETINEMMDSVANYISSDPPEISESITSPKEKYRDFFHLSSELPQEKVSDYHKTAYIMYTSIMKSKLAEKFQQKSAKRFLMHLLVHHCLIIRKNSFGDLNDSTDSRGYSFNLDLMTSYFNHSCIPNIVRLSKNNSTVIKSILPIRQGHQIFISYLDAFDMDDNLKEIHLQEIYGFKCDCQLCIKGIIKVPGLENDSIFLNIDEKTQKLAVIPSCDIGLVQDLKNLCVKFLLKYPNCVGSKETDFITDTLGTMFQKELEAS